MRETLPSSHCGSEHAEQYSRRGTSNRVVSSIRTVTLLPCCLHIEPLHAVHSNHRNCIAK